MANAAIFQAIAEHREAVRQNEKIILHDLARHWVQPYRYLKEQVDALTGIIENRLKEGKPVEPEYIYSHRRYRAMMEQAEKQIEKYNEATKGIITGAEADAVEIGNANARKLVNLAEPDDPMWTRINTRETRILSGMLTDRSPLSDLLKKSWPETTGKIHDVLYTGLSTGQGSSWIADRLMDAVNIPLERALVIARTEVNRVYREANLETMRESRAVIGYRRMCYPPTACFACLMMDGEFYEKSESFSDHPNGKCSAVPVTKHFDPINEKGWERGQDWFMRQNIETQEKIMGKGRYELWQRGTDPRDMVYIKQNPLWGGSPTVRTLKELGFGYKGSDLHNIYDISGARITDPYSPRGEDFAEMEYNEIRLMKNDVSQIAKNIGEEETVIREIKEYIFINDSLFDEDLQSYRRFDPDCAIAQSWQRLYIGRDIKPHDRTLIQHEKLEMEIKRENPGISHDEAHTRAAMVYNYGKEAVAYYGSLEKHK